MKREKAYLSILIVISFIIRLIPHRNLLLATYDEYLHRDITLRIVNEGFGVISKDLSSLLGLKAYSYPPLFHIIGAVIYKIFPSDYTFFLLPAIYGILTITAFYYLSKEILKSGKKAFLATLLLAFAPNFVYRSSLYIPENLGLLMFTIGMLLFVRFLRRQDIRYLMSVAVLIPIYMVTHRGWVFFISVIGIMILIYLLPWIKRNLHYFALIITVGVALYFLPPINRFIAGLLLRMPREEVSALGYFKWIGVIQLLFGALATKRYLERDVVRKGIALWAWTFLILGSVAFRFRDPYASFPLSIMAAEFIYDELIPKLEEIFYIVIKDIKGRGSSLFRSVILSKKMKALVIALLILTPIAQGAYSSYKYIIPPTVKDKEAFEWIKENTPKDATFLTWWDVGYLLIGNTHRKDIVMWKKVYQGFMGEAPDPREAIQAYNDVVTIFGTVQRERAYKLIEKYNATYIYTDRRMRTLGLLKYGLLEYVTYDTHFKTLFVNGNSEVYKYIPNPALNPKDMDKIEYSGKYSGIIRFLEKFWTGYNYADFDEGYKGDYYLNARIAKLYAYLYKETGNEKLKERYEWLLKWLAYKQLENGGFIEGIPPNDFTLYTTLTMESLKDLPFDGKQKALNLLKERTKEDYIMTTPKDTKGDLIAEAQMLPILYELGVLNETTTQNIIEKILEKQENNGQWKKTSLGGTIAVAFGLARYYQLSGDERALEAVKRAAEWITTQQEENGRFKGESGYGYSRATYANVLFIYHVAGLKDREEQLLRIIKETFDLQKEPRPLQATLDILRALEYSYGLESALDTLEIILELHSF